MKESELTEFEVEEKDLKLRITRGPQGVPIVQSNAPALSQQPPYPPQTSGQPQGAAGPGQESSDQSQCQLIHSPMVGTFYRTPSPESKPFVEVGSKINPDSVVCIVEAMKVMNEIPAECSGEIVEVLAENEQTVEYGQPLFKLKTS
mgnify:CR=1 FL=1